MDCRETGYVVGLSNDWKRGSASRSSELSANKTTVSFAAAGVTLATVDAADERKSNIDVSEALQPVY